MNKYKLINYKTKEEHFCEKVTIDGFDYYVNDDEIKYGDSYLCLEIKPNGHKSPFFGKVYKYDNFTTDNKYEKYLLQNCKKVIATNNPSIDLPKIINEIERMALQKFPVDYQEVEIKSLTDTYYDIDVNY